MLTSVVSLDATRLQLRKQITGLLTNCPLCVHPAKCANPKTCPLYQLRKRAVRTQRRWLALFSLTDLQYLAEYHQVCYTQGLSSLHTSTISAVRLFRACLKLA